MCSAWWKVPLLLIAPLVAGCGQKDFVPRDSNCSYLSCDRFQIDREPIMSDSSLSWDGTSFPLRPDGHSDEPPPSGSCNVDLTAYGAAAYLGSSLPDISRGAHAVCIVGDLQLSFGVHLEDIRDEAPGAYPVQVTHGELRSVACAHCDVACVFDGAATMTIEEAQGGAAAFPALVTPDYRKVFRVEVTSLDEQCAAVSASLHFTTVAAAMHGEDDTYCRRCEY